MNKCVWIGMIGIFIFVSLPHQSNADPILAVIKAGVKKAIKAVDLMIQRLQNQTIKLQNAQKAIENALSKLRLKEIAEWGEKQRTLFAGYYEELQKVKAAIAYYKRVRDIIQKQIDLVEEYKHAFTLFRQDKHFSEKELEFMYQVYSGIMEESIKNLEEITLVINSFVTQMSDADRLELINKAGDKIDKNLLHLRQFTNQNILLSLQRAKDIRELELVKEMYGLTE